MNKKLIIILSLAVMIAMVITAFPLHIEPSHNSDWPFVITIGSPVSAQEADYTCDGTADNVQFQAALNALPSDGGQLFVLAGNYTFADSTTVTRAIDHISIIGVSAAVSFTGDGTTAIFTAGGDGWLFSNLEVDAGGLNMSTTTDYMWLHVIVDSTYYPLKTDNINIEDHSALHGVGAADTIFPADPNADKYLMWDDDPGQLSWEDGGGIGDMAKSTYDQDEDNLIDTAAGGTEWDSSAAAGVAYITAGAWGTRATGISNTYIVIVDDADAANGDIPYFTNNGLAGYNEAEFKSAYNMEAGTDYQAQDAELQAIAGLTSGADKMIYFTGSGTAATADLTAFARSILDDADEASFKATVNLEIGTDVQAYDAELSALAGLTSATDKLPYFTGSGTADVTGLSAFTRGFLDDSDEATFKATVNLEIGTDVLAYDATLASIADLGTAADKIAYTTGVDTWAETGLTAFARSILDDVDEATFKATVNLEIGTDVLAQQTIGIADNNLVEMDDADAADNDYAKFTANGLEGRDYSEIRSDLEVPDTTAAAVTLYVDAGSGNDNNEGSSGSPKATIQGALDALPVVIAHTCTICVRGPQSYAESNTAIEFSRFNTLASIIIKAVNANDEEFYDNGQATGGSSTTLQDTAQSWATDQFDDAYVWIYDGSGQGDIFEIASNTANTLTITGGTFSATPDSTTYYAIGGGTSLTGTDSRHFYIVGKNVEIYGFKHTGATGRDIEYAVYAYGRAYNNYFDSASVDSAIKFSDTAEGFAYYNYIDAPAGSVGIFVVMASAYPRANIVNGGAYGVRALYGSIVSMAGSPYVSYLKGCTSYGVYAATGSGVVAATSQDYNSCGTNYGADANSWYT